MGTWDDHTLGLVVLPDGRRVRGRGLRRDPLADGERPEFGIYLTGRRYEADEWPSIWVAWPDFRIPKYPVEAIVALHRPMTRP